MTKFGKTSSSTYHNLKPQRPGTNPPRLAPTTWCQHRKSTKVNSRPLQNSFSASRLTRSVLSQYDERSRRKYPRSGQSLLLNALRTEARFLFRDASSETRYSLSASPWENLRLVSKVKGNKCACLEALVMSVPARKMKRLLPSKITTSNRSGGNMAEAPR